MPWPSREAVVVLLGSAGLVAVGVIALCALGCGR